MCGRVRLNKAFSLEFISNVIKKLNKKLTEPFICQEKPRGKNSMSFAIKTILTTHIQIRINPLPHIPLYVADF